MTDGRCHGCCRDTCMEGRGRAHLRRSPVPQWPAMPGREGSCCACKLRSDPQKHEGRSKGGLATSSELLRERGARKASTRGTGQRTVWRATCRGSMSGQKHQGSVNPRRQRDVWSGWPGRARVLVAASVQLCVPRWGCGPTALTSQPDPEFMPGTSVPPVGKGEEG